MCTAHFIHGSSLLSVGWGWHSQCGPLDPPRPPAIAVLFQVVLQNVARIGQLGQAPEGVIIANPQDSGGSPWQGVGSWGLIPPSKHLGRPCCPHGGGGGQSRASVMISSQCFYLVGGPTRHILQASFISNFCQEEGEVLRIICVGVMFGGV